MSEGLRVMMATDLGPAAPAMGHRLSWLSGHCRIDELALVHVVDDAALQAVVRWGFGARQVLLERCMAQAGEALERLRAKLRVPAATKVAVHCVAGRPETVLSSMLREGGFDLLLAGSGNRLWREGLLGSTARRLVRDVDCALWLAREDPDAAQQIDSALLAVDFGPGCERGLSAALGLWPGARLHAAHVLDASAVEQAAAASGSDPETVAVGLRGHASQRLQGWLDEHATKQPVSAEVLTGRPDKALLDAAHRLGVQALVLGRGNDPATPSRLGSTAESMTLRADCDLLLASR